MFIVNIGLLYIMYEWYNLTVRYREDWSTLGLQHLETGLFNRNYCDLFASWSMVPKLTNFHFPPCLNFGPFLAPAVTVGETEGAMDSASVLFFTSSFAYNFVRKNARITILVCGLLPGG